MGRHISVPEEFRKSGPEGENGEKKTDAKIVLPEFVGDEPDEEGHLSDSSVPGSSEKIHVNKPIQIPVKESARRYPPKRRPGRPSRPDGSPLRTLKVPIGLLMVLTYEKAERFAVLGESVSMGDILSEALSYYLKKTRKGAYEKYKDKGLIK